MVNGRSGVVFQQMSRLLRFGTVGGLGEVQLLERFIERKDEGAFEALLARHGPMVLGVCRQVLRDPHEVEDAFQATFLVLVRRAGSIRQRERLASWLYGVAHRIAIRAKQTGRDRPVRDSELVLEPSVCEVEEREQQAALHEEVNRLPDKYRAPIVLCYLEGLTHDEAATRLGWPVGTVRGRMARGRDVLRRRLTLRGVAFSASAFAARVAVPEALAATTVRTALSYAGTTRMATGVVSAQVLALLEGALHAMFVQKMKVAATGVLAALLFASGAGVLAYQAADERANDQRNETVPASKVVDEVLVEKFLLGGTTPTLDDPTFLRRVYLVLLGRLPSPDEVRSFVDEKVPDKRAKLVERLSRTPASSRHGKAAAKPGPFMTAELLSRAPEPDGRDGAGKPDRPMITVRPVDAPNAQTLPVDQRVKSEVRELELEADREHLRHLLRMQREMEVEELTNLLRPSDLDQELAELRQLPLSDEERKLRTMELERRHAQGEERKRTAEHKLRHLIEQLKRSYVDQKIEFEESRRQSPGRASEAPEGQDGDGFTSQTYDVGDLLLPPSADGSRGSDKADMSAIIALIKNSTARGTWAEDGKPASTPGSITPFFPRASIIVRQTPAGHEEVRVLLQGLRRLQEAQLANAGKAAPKPGLLKKD